MAPAQAGLTRPWGESPDMGLRGGVVRCATSAGSISKMPPPARLLAAACLVVAVCSASAAQLPKTCPVQPLFDVQNVSSRVFLDLVGPSSARNTHQAACHALSSC